ncbi:MAG TPA: adenylate/guanylate cyclase domain-containing protein [Chthoniobacterales bacterium]|nr:adenylate/guanylate cyclase domain-containing protein [Chthoniobacterales bacterium]
MHWLGRHRRVALALICALCTGAIVAAALLQHVLFADSIWANETSFRDALERKARRTRVHDEFVFLGIDEASKQLDQVTPEELQGSVALQKIKQGYPWDRAVYAELVDRLCEAGARLIVFDLAFGPDRAGTAEFGAALDRHRDRVVIGADIETNGNAASDSTGVILVPPNKALIAGGLMDDRVGYVSIFPDPDTLVRRVHYALTDLQIDRLMNGLDPIPARPWETIYESLDARALRKLGSTDRVPAAGRSGMIRFGPNEAYQPHSLYEIFVPAYWEHNYRNGAFFKDKIVLVGTASAIEHDVHPTPISGATSGPLIHFHAIAAALDGEFLSETSPFANLLLLLGAGLAAWTVVTFVRQTLVAILLLFALSAAYLGVVVFYYNTHNLFLLTVPVLGAFNLSGLFSLGYDFTLERMEKLRTRRTLERYVSKNLVKEILDNPDSFYSSLRGVRLPATVLFSDIVGFTSLTESADPEKLVAQLNEYLSRMTAAVFENNGTLDKFIGDAVMAVWGNVSSRGLVEDAKSCARTALAMRRELRALNEKWKAQGIAPFQIGIGINHGDVLVGNIGSQEKADPTVIGDAVNLASRLEALTRTYPVDILVGARAAELIRDEFDLRSVALVQVKGKTQPVEIFTMIGATKDRADSEGRERLQTYEAAFRKFRERDFTQAKIFFSQFLEFYPDDALAKMYLERALEYEEQPPDAAWNAVEVFKKK